MSNYSQKYDQREIPGCLMFRSGIRCVHEKCFRSYRNKISFPPCFRKFQEGGCSSGKNCEFRHSPDLKKESDKLAKMRSDIMGRLSERDGPSNNRSGGRPSERRSDRRPGSEGLQDRQNNRSGTQNSGGQQGGGRQDRQQSGRPKGQSNGRRQSGQSGGQQSGRQRGRRDGPRQNRQSGQSGGQQQSGRQGGQSGGRQGGQSGGKQRGRQGGQSGGRQGGQSGGKQRGRQGGQSGGRQSGQSGGQQQSGRQGGQSGGQQRGRQGGQSGGRQSGQPGGQQSGRQSGQSGKRHRDSRQSKSGDAQQNGRRDEKNEKTLSGNVTKTSGVGGELTPVRGRGNVRFNSQSETGQSTAVPSSATLSTKLIVSLPNLSSESAKMWSRFKKTPNSVDTWDDPPHKSEMNGVSNGNSIGLWDSPSRDTVTSPLSNSSKSRPDVKSTEIVTESVSSKENHSERSPCQSHSEYQYMSNPSANPDNIPAYPLSSRVRSDSYPKHTDYLHNVHPNYNQTISHPDQCQSVRSNYSESSLVRSDQPESSRDVMHSDTHRGRSHSTEYTHSVRSNRSVDT
eukprot:264398_1